MFSQRVPWLRVDRLLGEMGIGADSAAGRREFARRMQASRRVEVSAEYRKIRRGLVLWRGCVSAGTFAAGQRANRHSHHYGRVAARESAEDKAGRLVRAALKEAGWEQSDLARRRRGDPVRLPGAAVAAGNDDAAEMDLPAAGNGVLEIRQPEAL